MTFATRSAISKALRPDHPSTAAELADALKLFNAFISDNRKAGHQRGA